MEKNNTTYRVFGNVDVLLLAVLNQLWLEETWVALNLVSSRNNASAVNQSLKVLLGVVGDTDRAGLLLGKLGHSLPCVDNGDIVQHLDVLTLQWEKVVVNVRSLVKSDGEVNEVEVEVVEAELSQAVVESWRYILGAVLRVPQLGCNEDILTLEAGYLATKGLLERSRNLLLVSVDLGKIQVAVSSLEGLKDSGADLSRLSLPRTKAQLSGREQ